MESSSIFYPSLPRLQNINNLAMVWLSEILLNNGVYAWTWSWNLGSVAEILPLVKPRRSLMIIKIGLALVFSLSSIAAQNQQTLSSPADIVIDGKGGFFVISRSVCQTETAENRLGLSIHRYLNSKTSEPSWTV